RGPCGSDPGIAFRRAIRWHRRSRGARVVAHILRLRFALMFGALRGEHVVRTVVRLLIVIAATVTVCIAMMSLASAPLPVARTVVVLVAAAIMLGFLVGPVLTGAVDQLDPRRFAVFG